MSRHKHEGSKGHRFFKRRMELKKSVVTDVELKKIYQEKPIHRQLFSIEEDQEEKSEKHEMLFSFKRS